MASKKLIFLSNQIYKKNRQPAVLKKLFILIFFSLVANSFSQQNAKPKQKPVGRPALTQMVSATDHDTCLNKKFSIVFYAFQDSAFALNVNAMNTVTIQSIIDTLNARFGRICVSFESCSLKVIPNYEYNTWTEAFDDVVTTNWFTPQTINVYLVEMVVDRPYNEKNGYAHNSQLIYGTRMTNRNAIVINCRLGVFELAKTTLHVFGHFFGLHDTFAEMGSPASPPPLLNYMSNEFADRSNCYVNGDLLCDTEADPFPVSYYEALPPAGSYCQYYPVIKDGRQDWYTPPLDNLMSMYNCRCRFTQEQYNRMARFILNYRMDLH